VYGLEVPPDLPGREVHAFLPFQVGQDQPGSEKLSTRWPQ
jgi:hypothetical protein